MAATAKGDRLSFGTTAYANGLQGLLSATTSGASTYYERDPSGTLISERGPGGEFYYVTDGLGSTVALVDTTGTVQATYSYDPYGNATTVGGPNPANANPYRYRYRYAGGYYDTTTGLYHFGQRYYNPTTGRWTQQDSLNTPLDPTNGNRYAYTGDDPTNSIDPTGLEVLGTCDRVSLGAGFVVGVAALPVDAISGVGSLLLGTAASASAAAACEYSLPALDLTQNNPSGGPSNQTPDYSSVGPDQLPGPGSYR
jgi:RHS repeat-associated protein